MAKVNSFEEVGLLISGNIMRICGFIIFVVILLKVDRAMVLGLILDIDVLYLILSIILFGPQILFKAWRLQLLVRSQGVSYSIRDSFIIYAASMFVGVITPGKVGEFTRVFYLQSNGRSLKKSFACVLLDRFFDLGFLFLLAFIGIIIFSNLSIGYQLLLSLIHI